MFDPASKCPEYCVSTLTDGQHRDHERDADDEPEHRSKSPEFIVRKRFQRNSSNDSAANSINPVLLQALSCGMNQYFAERGVFLHVSTISPSARRSTMLRLQNSAISDCASRKQRSALPVQLLKSVRISNDVRIEVYRRLVGQNHHRIVPTRPAR